VYCTIVNNQIMIQNFSISRNYNTFVFAILFQAIKLEYLEHPGGLVPVSLEHPDRGTDINFGHYYIKYVYI
jgi:hypothetical protein